MSMPAILFERSDPQAIAIRTSSRSPLTYAALRAQIDYTIATLNGVGIGRNDRVAAVLRNSPEAACAFLSVAAGSSFAPLNHEYKEPEFDFYLKDLKPKALIVEVNSASPAIRVATGLNTPVIYLHTSADFPAGKFFLDTGTMKSDHSIDHGGYGNESDEGMVLHTSGTTGRPKIVPLTLKNIASSAYNISHALSLNPAKGKIRGDVGLVIMPMFHIHGLLGSILSPLYAGSSIFCPPGFFSPTKFFDWMTEARPTWYSGVPAMHQLILKIGARPEFADVIAKSTLRFIRSSSDSLPPAALEALENAFRTVVVESYGMTEAAHQMASNPMDKARRKPGTVGFPAGPEIRIRDEDGNFVSAGQEGAIVIRGDNVTIGYYENPAANAEDFKDGWFDTGDIGFFDDEGYLTICGRKKDVINRGGEKIMPIQVGNVLLAHPAVAQAEPFGFPDKLLGQRVGAAIVFREGQTATVDELRAFALERLARFKVPEQFAFVSDIPKGPTGKINRNLLAAQLGFVCS